MKILDLKNNTVVVNPEVLTIPEFATIWKEDKSKDKELAFKHFTFIYHLCDFNSPYANQPRHKKEDLIKLDCLGDAKYVPANSVQLAIDKYRELQETPLQRLLKSARNKVDDIAQYLDDTDINDDNVKNILDAFGKISVTVSNFDKLQEAVNKEKEANNVHVRGNKEINNKYNE